MAMTAFQYVSKSINCKENIIKSRSSGGQDHASSTTYYLHHTAISSRRSRCLTDIMEVFLRMFYQRNLFIYCIIGYPEQRIQYT